MPVSHGHEYKFPTRGNNWSGWDWGTLLCQSAMTRICQVPNYLWTMSGRGINSYSRERIGLWAGQILPNVFTCEVEMQWHTAAPSPGMAAWAEWNLTSELPRQSSKISQEFKRNSHPKLKHWSALKLLPSSFKSAWYFLSGLFQSLRYVLLKLFLSHSLLWGDYSE